jgi:flagellar biosynthetic protein FliR
MLSALQHIIASLGFHHDIGTFITVFGLVLARLVAAISLAPFMGGRSTASQIKIGIAFLTGILLFPLVAPRTGIGELTAFRVLCLLVKEGVIGGIIGFLAQIIFQSVQMAGATIDYSRGMSQATFFAPQLETNVSLLGQLQLQATIVLFLIFNGHLFFLRALAASFARIPVLEFPHFSGGILPAVDQMARYTADGLVIAVQLSAPVLVALFLVDVSFGVIGKVASGFNVHNESQPVKALLGLGVLFLTLSYIVGRMPSYFADLLHQIEQFVMHVA